MSIDKFIFPIFIINLKEDIEKKEHMQKLCQRLGLEVKFISDILYEVMEKPV